MKSLQEKSNNRSRIFLEICLIFVIILLFFSTPLQVGSTQNRVLLIDEEGIFSLSNTSDRYILFKETIYANERHIGTTWNLTIEISSNSSTGVKFSFESQATDWFEGIKEFQVDPNKARSEVYIAHCTSDETPGFNFLYSLLSPEKNASGIYKIERIHPGYLLDEGSDQSCVWDISAWLKRTISTSSSSIGSSQAVPSLTFILCLITLVYVGLITGKKRRKNAGR